jgi:hypothetical protein
MKRCALVFVTLFTLVLTGVILPRTAGSSPHSSRIGWLHGAPVHDPVKVRSFLDTEAGWRYRHGLPTHWRACLLQH